MSDKTPHMNTPHKQSALERISLSFEYNVTFADEKKAIRERTA